MEDFLKYSNGSTVKAQMLYVWNGKVSASLWEIVSYLEIAIRALVDSQFDSASQLANWLDDPEIIRSTDPIRSLIDQAKSKALIYRPSPTREQVLEQLPLGFLQALLSKRYLHLWPTLAAGFKGCRRSDQRETSFFDEWLENFEKPNWPPQSTSRSQFGIGIRKSSNLGLLH
jgi:hypothetical protein